jgi:hypothetical protein
VNINDYQRYVQRCRQQGAKADTEPDVEIRQGYTGQDIGEKLAEQEIELRKSLAGAPQNMKCYVAELEAQLERDAENIKDLTRTVNTLKTKIRFALERYQQADDAIRDKGFLRGSLAWAMADDLEQALKTAK